MIDIACVLLTTLAIISRVNADFPVYQSPYQYILVTTAKTWEEAKEDCTTRKAHLVKIDSKAITNIITTNSDGTQGDMWIGANDSATEGEWKWLDGTSAKKGDAGTYANWANRQPNNADADNNPENCALVYSNGKWNDADCTLRLKYICQKGLHLVFAWIPSHVGIKGNQLADWLARNAACSDQTPLQQPSLPDCSEIKSEIQNLCRDLRDDEYRNSGKGLFYKPFHPSISMRLPSC